MDKYYLKTKTSKYDPTKHYIIRNNQRFEITLEENVDIPDFSIGICKQDKHDLKRPKSEKDDKYKEITNDLYSNYYQPALKNLRSTKWEKALCYVQRHEREWIQATMFSEDPKNQFCIEIDCRNWIDYCDLTVFKKYKHYSKGNIKRFNKQIDEVVFTALLRETIKFLSDENSFELNISDYFSMMNKILEGEIPEAPEESVNVDNLIKQLEVKRTDLVNRLIENDSDPELTRASLRGEKEGIEYSIRAIKKYFRL